jgi:N-hydroxyarylamine O-acetyltransferase
MHKDLSAYLNRIGYLGAINPSLAVLRAIHRAHLLSISYENLDIHLGRRLLLDSDAMFEKIVSRRRGGWCYEMNGLLAWALQEIGFDVTLLGGTVAREHRGDSAEGNHLVLLVQLDQPWLADAGFGNGILEPLPLSEGEFVQYGFRFRLERSGERWFFHNHQYGGTGFDFTLKPHNMHDFSEQCHWLQTAPDSGFVRLTTCHRWCATDPTGGIDILRGAILQHVTPNSISERTIEHETDYRQVLHETFALDLGDDLGLLWAKVSAAHRAWVLAQYTNR